MKNRQPQRKTGPGDWLPARVVYELRLVGWTLRRVSTQAGFDPTTIGKALYQPYPGAEQIVANKLGIKPWVIWPSRYDQNHQPIPRRNLNRASRELLVPKHSALTVSDNGNIERGHRQ